MALREPLVPLLPPTLRRLYDYLLTRDLGAPSGTLTPLELTELADGDVVLDRIAWDYAPGGNLERRDPDGFVVWWQQAATDDPVDGGILLAGDARAYAMTWPAGLARSYAVAPYRATYQGLQAAPKAQHDSWRIA